MNDTEGKPGSAKAVAAFIAGAVASTAIGWYVKDTLDRPVLNATVLSATAGEDSKAEFTLFYLGMIEEFVGDLPGFKQELLDVAKGLEKEGLDFRPEGRRSTDRTASFMSTLMSARDRLMKKVPMSSDTVQSGLTKATQAMQKLRQAQLDVANFLLQNPKPAAGSVSTYSALFLKYDDDPFYTKYIPPRPPLGASAEQWHSTLTKTAAALERTISVLDTGTTELSNELEAASKAAKRKTLDVLVIVKNTGNSPGSLFTAAAVELETAERDRLFLQTDSDVAELVVPAKGHKTVRYRLVLGKRNPDDIWNTTMQRYRSASTQGRVKLVTIDGQVIVSEAFPFYARDAYSDRAYKLLEK